MATREGTGPSPARTARITVGDIHIERLVTLDLDTFHYQDEWNQAKDLALQHSYLQTLGWPYWRVVRQLFVELGGLPVCWEDDYGRELADDHPDRAPWNPWPWWLDPEQRGCGRDILTKPAAPSWPSTDSLPKVANVDYNA